MSRYREDFTIFKRGKYWYYRTYSVDGIRSTAHSTGKKNKNEAIEWCKAEFSRGQLNGMRTTYGEYSRGFYDPDSTYCQFRKIRESTVRAYSVWQSRVILPYWQRVQLCDITYTRLQKFAIELQKEYTPSSVSSILTTMKNVLTSARRDGLIASDPFEFLMLKKEHNVRDGFTKEEVQKVIEASPEPFKGFFLLLACTGLRAGEALALDESSVHDGLIVIDRSRNNAGKITPTKTGVTRTLPVIPELMPYILEKKKFYTKYREAMADAVRLCSDYEKRKLSMHSFRHFFLTSTKASGVPESMAERYAGHSLKGITDVYTNYHAEDYAPLLEWQRSCLDMFRHV